MDNYSPEEIEYYDNIERSEDAYKTLLDDYETRGEIKAKKDPC